MFLAFMTSLIDETPPEIITGQLEILATFDVSSKFGLSLVPSLLISVKTVSYTHLTLPTNREV